MAGWLCCAAAALVAGCARQSGGPSVTFQDLAATLVDDTRLARLDAASGELVSSYDRTGGNTDYNNALRKGPKGWVVLADLTGPGYVSRFWMTGAENGWPVRFHFDGERKPRIDTTVDEFCGGKAPFLPPLATYDPFCWYSLVPVPYRKRLVIMAKEGGYKADAWPRLFYQINYCTLTDGMSVESFPAQLSPADVAALNRVREALMPYNDPLSRKTAGKAAGGGRREVGGGRAAAEESATHDRVRVAPGQRAAFPAIPGPAVFRRLEFTPDLSGLTTAVARAQAMRNLILRIYWEQGAKPSVEAPFGDFFGSVWQARQFESFYFGMTGGVFYTRFPMPFQKSARIELENQAGAEIGCQLSVIRDPWSAVGGPLAKDNAVAASAPSTAHLPPSASPPCGYFHAGWKKSTAADIGRPHAILETAGAGRYAGCILSATSLDKSWWLLEGDETMHVDGETAPRWRGTGLEDYFNGGWYYGRPIVRPFNGLLMKAFFRTVQYRVHHADPVSFERSLAVRMERGPDNASHGTYESVAFYYLRAPAAADTALGDAAFRAPPADPLAGATIMSELNDLDLLGDVAGDREYAAACVERMGEGPFRDVLKLRMLMADETARGFAAVKGDVEGFAAATTNAAARQYASDGLWYQSGTNNALLGAYADTRTQVFLDGRIVGETGDPQRMQFFRLNAAPGRHVLAFRVRNRPYPRWVQACLRTHAGDVVTGPDWKNAANPAGNWAAVDYDDSAWDRVGGPDRGKGPPEEPYVWLEPHPFIGMQSDARGIWITKEWTDMGNGFGVLRQAFDVKP